MAVARAARALVGRRYMPEHHLDLPIEMDALPAQPSATGKYPASHKSALSRRDYIVGICLLLLVVFLWTTSNFVTQVRLESQKSPLVCSIYDSYACLGSIPRGIRETFLVRAILSSIPAVARSLSRPAVSRTSQRARLRCTFYLI